MGSHSFVFCSQQNTKIRTGFDLQGQSQPFQNTSTSFFLKLGLLPVTVNLLFPFCDEHFLLKPLVVFWVLGLADGGILSAQVNGKVGRIFKVTDTVCLWDLWDIYGRLSEFEKCCLHKKKWCQKGKYFICLKFWLVWKTAVGSLKDVTKNWEVPGSTLTHAWGPGFLIFMGHDL